MNDTKLPVRIAPLEPAEWTETQRAVLEPAWSEGRVYNVIGVLARHWKAYDKFRVWSSHVMGDTQTLPPRDRELVILRTGLRCESPYEWAQHVVIARSRAGLTEDDIARVEAGPDAPGWQPHEAALLRAADELRDRARISDSTWSTLASHYSIEQLMDVVFSAGQYTLVSMALNSFGVPVDEGLAAIRASLQKSPLA